MTRAGVDQLQKKLPKARIQASSENARPDVREGKLPGIVKVGDSAPAFKLTTLDGKALSLADYRGKYLLVFFWATWCAPCKAEMPRLRTTYNTFGHDPSFAMLGLSLDESRDAPLRYTSEHNLPWGQGYLGPAPASSAGVAYAVGGLPSIWLIGPDGKLLAKDLRGEEVDAVLTERNVVHRSAPR